MFDLGILNGNCYINDSFKKTNIYVQEGRIASITDAVLPCIDTVDALNLTVLPGFIDPHVHLNLDLGEFKSRDDFHSGSIAAAFGGVTTIIDFLDPIIKNSELKNQFEKRLIEASSCHVDYAFHCTLGNYNDNVQTLIDEIQDCGISSIKVFTTYKESNRMCSYDVIEKILSTGTLLLAHSEDNDLIYSPKNILTYEASRSEKSELSAVKKLIDIQKMTRGRLYIVHVSSGHTLKEIDSNNSNLYLESCPQYFYLSRDLFAQENGCEYLLAPPLRSRTSIAEMKENFNLLSTIGTDHCPFNLSDKYKYKAIDKIPKGIGSLEFAFPLMYQLFGYEIINHFTKNPADIFNLTQKGRLEVGRDADIVLFNENLWTDCNQNHSNSDYTVYKDMVLKGKIVKTYLRGELIVEDDKIYERKGNYLRRYNESNH